ncbi:MAG: FAD-binding oxidoreductase, partial [Gammaproteobacteria bacterium]|nr:FAD-binding oxidoreductase [Gammaproteobacteria bacterium]
RGARVAVLETYAAGWGASSRNGGMVLTGLKLDAATLLGRYGRELARELFRASVESVDLVEELVRAEGIDCDFRRCGHLALASKPGHYAGFERGAELLAREFSHGTRLVPRAALRDEIGSGLYHGGMLDEASGGINPARYVAGLARAAQVAGATLHGNARVQRLERLGARWRLPTTRGVVEAGEVLVATSGYTGPATPALRRRLLPVGSYIITTESLPAALARELSPTGRMMYDSRHFLHYFRLTPDRRLLIGGRARFVPENARTVRASAAVLQQGMLAIYPQLRDARVEYAWGGTLDFAFDTMPHAGSIDGCHYALGYAGHGVALATYLGMKMGAAIGTGEFGANPFTRLPFRGAPFGLHIGKDWVLPLVAAWYKLLDWVD